MSRAVIAIEEARAQLTEALEAVTPAASDAPESTDGP